MSLAGLETEDLGQFNFDINDLNYLPPVNDPSFDFTFDPQFSNFQFDNNLGHTPIVSDQYGLDQWASPIGGDMPVHTRPHPSGPSQDSGQLDLNFQAGWPQDASALMIVMVLAATLVVVNLAYLRQASSQWIGNDPIVAVVKLTLCAILTAQLPNYLSRLLGSADRFIQMGLAVTCFFFATLDNQSCQSAGSSNTYFAEVESYSTSGREQRWSSWLATMSEPSPVAV